MNKSLATMALMAVVSTSMAAPGWRDDRSYRDDRGGQRSHEPAPVYRGDGYRHQFYAVPPRAYYRHAWRRGERYVPYGGRAEVLRGHRYGYYGSRLYAPPRGAQWVRVNDDALLTAIATGVVLDVVYNLNF